MKTKVELKEIENSIKNILEYMPKESIVSLEYVEKIHFLGDKGWAWPVIKDHLTESSICYCVGAGGNVSFDIALYNEYKSNIFIIDPTKYAVNIAKKAMERAENPDKIKLIEVALSDEEGGFKMKQNPQGQSHSIIKNSKLHDLDIKTHTVPCKTLSTLMKEYNHTKIHMLKIDIEGSEYKVIEDILSKKIDIDIINVEFHGEWLSDKWSKCASYKDLNEIIEKLIKKGYILTYQNGYREYMFVKEYILVK